MSQTKEARPGVASGAGQVVELKTGTSVAQLADIWSWTGIYLDDGRVTSIAALRGYRGAVEAVRRGC